MITHELALDLFGSIESTELKDLRRDLVERAINYAHFRSRWPLLDFDERREFDAARTSAHNTFIDACNILSRNMAQVGEDIGWRASLGEDRRIIGDFACYIALFLSLRGR